MSFCLGHSIEIAQLNKKNNTKINLNNVAFRLMAKVCFLFHWFEKKKEEKNNEQYMGFNP